MAESNDNDNDNLERWVQTFNKGHGYAGVFNSDTKDDMRIVERSTIEEWRVSIEMEFGIVSDTPQPNPDDPPDFFVSIGGQQLNVELVQMVEQEYKQRAANDETPFSGQLFQDMQWSRERFVSKLNELIANKGKKYEKAGVRIDVLLIHTAEPWLTSTEAQAWLEVEEIMPHPSIRSASLLFDYEPGRGVDHWPVLTVCGELIQKS
ncbi:hypothetical protein [Sedimentitalea nanhaiensis]|uniref:Uncharacterized protein n=1 Tax=Sedimentitalea nanhaiensis TaxID=999627 RepID=A0A1I6ZIT4_9RHOB|nr:hypothetical protein [Sedimentitalea nanhaiensis]SFT62596.1 hypothetical protein SAMN05216236_104138 [Sedimentitalea nanhaiensis]